MAALIIWYAKNIGGMEDTARIANTSSALTIESSTTALQLFNKIKGLIEYIDEPTFYSTIYLQQLYLFFCTLYQPTSQYCYNTVFADATLNGGKPEIEEIYGIIDVYNWSGWISVFLLVGFWYFIKTIFAHTVVTIGYVLFFGASSNLPFCLPGDFMLFSWDVCGGYANPLSATRSGGHTYVFDLEDIDGNLVEL